MKLRRCRIVGASASASATRRKSPSVDGRLRQAHPNSRTVTEATHASIRRFRSLALSKSEVALPKREVSGVRCVGMPSTSDVPCLRYVRGQPSFDAGTNVVPALLGRNPDELENSEDRGSAGGHGNQHVRLRGASIDASKRSARLRQQLVAAGRASCTIPQEVLRCLHQEQGADPAKGNRNRPQPAAGRRSDPNSPLSNLHSKRSDGSPMVPASC